MQGVLWVCNLLLRETQAVLQGVLRLWNLHTLQTQVDLQGVLRLANLRLLPLQKKSGMQGVLSLGNLPTAYKMRVARSVEAVQSARSAEAPMYP